MTSSDDTRSGDRDTAPQADPTGTSSSLIGTVHQAIADIGQAAWDQCAGLGHPFVSYDFLNLMEETGCVSAETGWLPHHLSLRDQSQQIKAVMPLYLKGNSYGEYIFDHSWAAAYERAGGHYYPKLLCAIPFSPVTGPRLLISDDQPESSGLVLAQMARTLCEKQHFSSLHFNFLQEDTAKQMEDQGFLIRHDQQFHWQNEDFGSFDDFLTTLASRKRKNLRKERAAAQSDVTIHCLTGADLKPHHWDAFYSFYMDTSARKWGRPYLNRAFFEGLGDKMADDILLVMAEKDGDLIAGALNIIGSETLYGRYWGCTQHVDFLHFEICYYQAIDFAIQRGLKRVEAGAQGQHKLARGYAPTKTYSAHWLPDPGFRTAVSNYLDAEKREISLEIDFLNTHSPFKKPG